MNRVLNYFNPIIHLGDRKYSVLFPLVGNVSVGAVSELYSLYIAKDPNIVGNYIIFVNIVFVIYFAFREGILGGFIATTVSLMYYSYIIYTRHYFGSRLSNGIEMVVVLAVLYYFLTAVIGWLKQTIDKLIEIEENEKIRLREIIEQLPVGILITDNKGRVELGNRQVEEILGRDIPEGLIAGNGTIPNAKYNGRPVSPSEWPLAMAFTTGKPVGSREFIVQRKDRKKIYLQVSASLVHNREQKVIAAASIINDITSQKEIELRKDEFINMASHELKTPITSMKLYADVLMKKIKEFDDRSAVKMLGSIKQQMEKLQELVGELLDVSRIQTGKISFKKDFFPINGLIEETVEGLRPTAKRHEIKFSGKTNVKVYADKFRIYQVLTNLITNAVKYSPKGGSINIRLKRADGKAIVSIQDFGIGIAKNERSKIFDRLYQVGDVTGKTFPGLGIGLYISKEIIKRHRGTIWVESEQGKGSIFYFSLPLKNGVIS